MYKYDSEGCTFIDNINNNVIWSIYEDSLGTLWIGTEGGLNSFERYTGIFTTYIHDNER